MLAGSAGQPRRSHANISPDCQQDGEEIPAKSQAESTGGTKLYARVQTCQALCPNEEKCGWLTDPLQGWDVVTKDARITVQYDPASTA
jgi:hypothetical protein